MKIAVSALAVLVVVAAVTLWTQGRSRSTSPLSSPETVHMTLEQKLAELSECGLKLGNPFKPEDLLASLDRATLENQGYDLVLIALGMTEEQAPWRNHCATLRHFDTECIEDHGDYKKIAERMVGMAQGSLPLENIRDHVDIENHQAWLSFSFRGERIKIDCKVEDDWVDAALLGRFVQLLEKSDRSKIFVYYDLGGQDCIIGCVTKGDLTKLKRKGIRFTPLT